VEVTEGDQSVGLAAGSDKNALVLLGRLEELEHLLNQFHRLLALELREHGQRRLA
jgi:hypothetical protein